MFKKNAFFTLVQGGQRIFYSGFLEISICSIIGQNMLDLKEFTTIDEITVVATITYPSFLVIFIITVLAFTFGKSRDLVEVRKLQD